MLLAAAVSLAVTVSNTSGDVDSFSEYGPTQVIATASWQGTGSLNATIESPSESYTEDMVPVYQKTSYSTSSGALEMLNVKRLSISIKALSSDENWYITLDFDDVEEYTITVEIQK